VKKKQKRVMMIVLGVVAAGLCALKLGPILTGAPLVPPQQKKKSGTSQKKTARATGRSRTKRSSRSAGRARRTGSRRRTARRTSVATSSAPHDTVEEWPLELIPVDLSATGRRALAYHAEGLRNPFSPAKFEVARQSDALGRMKVNLQGIVRTAGRRLAIIEGRVYAEGEEVVEGVTLTRIDATSVLLTDGKNETRLSLNGRNPTIGTH